MLSVSDLGDLSQYTKSSQNDPKRRKLNSRQPISVVQPSTQSNYSNFRPGYIIKVVVSNFTTYSYAEFNLSPSLNMIIGPNGTGKSTLVAAICLGLGGKLDFIKRKSMKSMIKSGQTKSTIEITMKNHDGKPPIRIKRVFTEKESVWTLNNASSTEKAIKSTCREFNIQLDNLCHFLPQERVAEFAGLSPEKLLLETERTLGDGHLLVDHEKLIQMDNENIELKSRTQDIEARLTKLKEEKDELEEEAKKYKEYQKVVENLESHRKLIPYAQLSDMKKKQEHIKLQREEAKANLQRFKMKFNPIALELVNVRETLKNKESDLLALKEKSKEIGSRFQNGQMDYDSHNREIEKLVVVIKSLGNKSTEKRAELERLTSERDNLIREKANCPAVNNEELEQLIELRNAKQDQIDIKIHELEAQNDKLSWPHNVIKKSKIEIQRLQEKLNSKDKLDFLEPSGNYINQVRDGSYQAHKLLRSKEEFKGLYFEAPAVCCDSTDKRYSHYLEKVIDNNTLFSITVSSQENYRKISEFAFERVNFPMRVVTNIRESPRPIIPASQLKEYGFDGYLSDFIRGPIEVLNMLYDTAKIHNIPVSSKNFSDSEIQKLITPNDQNQIVFRKFIAGDTLFNVSRSNYGRKQIFYATEKIPNRCNYFGVSGLTSEVKQELNNQIEHSKAQGIKAKNEVQAIQDEMKSIEKEKEAIAVELEQYKQKLDKLTKLKSEYASLESRLKSKDKAVRRLEEESRKDYTDKINEERIKLQQRYRDRSAKMSELSQYSMELAQCEISLNLREIEVLEYKNRETSIRHLLNEVEVKLKELNDIYQEAKQKYAEIRNSPAAKHIKEQNENYTDEEKETLNNLAQTYMNNDTFTEHFIREKIQMLENEKSVKATADQSSIESLNKKLSEISRSEKDLPFLNSKRAKLEREIERIRKNWEPELEELVKKISLAFNKRFTKVASDGRVELAKNEKFQDWRLQILVKFRQESELKVLDHQSQSGGERAVSTIFFIMSLQGLTDAPLRVVDEINQGMDPKNEKMAHRYLVHTACKNSKSQYFLVTPKLLTGLYYHPDMVVHCIFTGPLIDPVERNSSNPDFMDFVRSGRVQGLTT